MKVCVWDFMGMCKAVVLEGKVEEIEWQGRGVG